MSKETQGEMRTAARRRLSLVLPSLEEEEEAEDEAEGARSTVGASGCGCRMWLSSASVRLPPAESPPMRMLCGGMRRVRRTWLRSWAAWDSCRG